MKLHWSPRNFFLAAAFVFLSVLLFAWSALALSKEDEIRSAWRDMLDKELTQEELQAQISDYRGADALKKELNASSERNAAIISIYQRALKRSPRPDELEFLKKITASTGAIRNQLFGSPERVLAIKDVYLGLLGREPSDSALDFYFKTRSDFGDIKKVLNDSPERKEAVKNIFQGIMGREASDSEISSYLNDLKYLATISAYLTDMKTGKAPVLSNVQVGVNEVGALVTFNINKKSTARVEYGLSSDYGHSLVQSKGLFRHNFAVDGLIPGIEYHYRIKATDEYGRETETSDGTFRTSPAVYVIGMPFYKQADKWSAGPAAVQMFLGFHGLAEEQSAIAEKTLSRLPIFDIYLAFPSNVADYIRSKGFSGTESYASRNPDNATLDYLKRKVAEGKPVLVKVQTGAVSESYKILVGYSDESKKFIFNNPARSFANYREDYDTFLKNWGSAPIYDILYKNWSFVIE